MSEDMIKKSVESSQIGQESVDIVEDMTKPSESSQSKKKINHREFRGAPYNFPKNKMTEIVKVVKILIFEGAEGIELLPALRLQKSMKINASDGYIYLK